MSEATDDASNLRLKLKLPRSMSVASVMEEAHKKLLIGARGGVAVKELLSTAPNIEVAIRDFQSAHGLAEAHAQIFVRKHESKKKENPMTFTPVVQLLDLLHVQRSSMYQSLLEQMIKEMLLRIAELPQRELPRVLEQTFPYIEYRELRAIPIAVLARQKDTPEMYLRELTENRRILAELPVHVRRKILMVDRRELLLFVEECTREYVTTQLDWYLNHPAVCLATDQLLATRNSNPSAHTKIQHRKRSLEESTGGNLWNVSSHVPSSSAIGNGSSEERRPSYCPDERRRNNPALTKLAEMLGDSESLYLSTLEIWRGYVVAANIPGATNNHAKEYVDYVPFLGAMRSDLANLLRDRTASLLRTDPLHKFIWFMDRAVKNQTLEIAQLHELLGFIGRLRTSDLPPNKKIRKKLGVEEEEENFEVVLGPPPVDELLVVLDKIAKIDARMIFAEPVPDDVPNYREIIKDPMDISTMRRRVKRGKYKTLDAFVSDFNLMIRNCMTFNPDTTVFYKEGKRIGKRGNELIERNATALRGEPQRIRTKKRRKTGNGPTNEALSMLTSSGVVTIKDFGDVDQSGMIPEGLCDEQLADVALVVSDPPVKQLVCEAIMKNLVVCWHRKDLPTDNLICRALVQLLQIGNPFSVRRMIRKQDFVLRVPQVVTMRVVLPLLMRSMVTFRVYHAFPASLQRDITAKDDILNLKLWKHVLRASSAIRAIVKSFTVQCLIDHQIDAASQLLHHLFLAEEDALLRDRVFLHAVGEVLLENVQAKAAAASTIYSNSNNGGSCAAENGEVTITLCEQLQALPIWTQIFDSFFVDVLGNRIMAIKEVSGSAVHFTDGALESSMDQQDTYDKVDALSKKRKGQHVVRSFPTPTLHEKTISVLSSLYAIIERGGSAAGSDGMIASYLEKTLGVLRCNCTSLEEFEALWACPVFSRCRQLYQPMLVKCPHVQKELFSLLPSDIEAEFNTEHNNESSAIIVDVKNAPFTPYQNSTILTENSKNIQEKAETAVINGYNATSAAAEVEDGQEEVLVAKSDDPTVQAIAAASSILIGAKSANIANGTSSKWADDVSTGKSSEAGRENVAEWEPDLVPEHSNTDANTVESCISSTETRKTDVSAEYMNSIDEKNSTMDRNGDETEDGTRSKVLPLNDTIRVAGEEPPVGNLLVASDDTKTKQRFAEAVAAATLKTLGNERAVESENSSAIPKEEFPGTKSLDSKEGARVEEATVKDETL
ncbi:hypothetical protein CCR75_002510 [Bremia lactucae]|uniref:Bromo domain-containing protein n=1 Tax=Bremia lactucae TaxID=4779 RepID=A0A976NYZ6_BRELC|nr:hypothetical protein CCR75_002510 [Bremia lactucae]